MMYANIIFSLFRPGRDVELRRSRFHERSLTCPGLPSTGFQPPVRKSGAIVYDSSDLTLTILLSRHSNSFPLQFTVTKGFQGDSVSINEGELYTAYFEKRTEVIVLKDWRGEECSLPVNSAVQIGILYDPNNSLDEALIGYEFASVGEVMKSPLKPTVLRVTQAYSDGKESRSVERDELLVVKRCIQTRFRDCMEAYSITKRALKKLKPSCQGRFTTNPHRVAMYAGDILAHVPHVFGARALMMSDSHAAFYSALPQQFLSEPVTLLRTVTETSLIVRPAQDAGQAYRLVEIPTSLDITVKIVPPGSNSPQKHSSKRDKFNALEAYKFRRVKTIDKSPMQRVLREEVRQGFEDTGVSLQIPPEQDTVYETIDEKLPERRHTIGAAPAGSDGYVTMVHNPQVEQDSSVPSSSTSVHVVSENATKNMNELATLSCNQVRVINSRRVLSSYISLMLHATYYSIIVFTDILRDKILPSVFWALG